MRFLVLVSLVVTSCLYGQNVPDQRNYPDHVISSTISTRIFDGHLDKLVPKWGDAASVSITRVLAEREIDENDVRVVLPIIRMAFREPNSVENEADRQPRTTLFVLRYLDRCTQSAGLKKEIVETKAYVEQQFTKYKEQQKPASIPDK